MNNAHKNITTSINVASPHGIGRVSSSISINNIILSDIILLGIIISILSLIIIR